MSDTITPAERALIDAAIKAGKVRSIPMWTPEPPTIPRKEAGRIYWLNRERAARIRAADKQPAKDREDYYGDHKARLWRALSVIDK